MFPAARFALLALFPALALVAGGCSKPAGLDSQALADHKARLVLAEEPDGGQTVLDVRYALLGEPASEGHDHGYSEEVADDEEDAAADDLDHAHGDEADHDHADEHDHDHADHDHADHDHGDDDHADHDHADHAEHAHAAASDKTLQVTMVGLVGGVTNPYKQAQPDFPFVKGQSTIFLADPAFVAEQAAEGHQHAPGEECAFCEAHAADAADAVAMVRLVDKAGKPIPVDARDLIAVKPGQTVVVTGTAKVQAGGVLVVDATGLYVRE